MILRVIRTVFLKRMISQVHEVVVNSTHVELIGQRGKTKIALLEHIVISEVVDQNPHPDVEFMPLYQQRILNILLNDQRSISTNILLQSPLDLHLILVI